MSQEARYVPALGYRWLTSLYDPVVRVTTRETAVKRRLAEQAGMQPGHTILDLGCGTGTLTIMLKTLCPDAEVIGLDGDPEVLEIARKKAKAAGIQIALEHGTASALPYERHSFDRVLSSLLFHHLSRADKERSFGEVHRVLRPSGEFHIADWGRAQNWPMRLAFLAVQLLDGFSTTGDNVAGLIPNVLVKAGFDRVEESAHYATLFGTLSLFKAVKTPS